MRKKSNKKPLCEKPTPQQKYLKSQRFLEELEISKAKLEWEADRKVLFAQFIYPSISSAARRILEIRASLNDLNVFPVKDNDTGDNMSKLIATLDFKVTRVMSQKEATADQLWQAFGEGLVEGAQGNSGIFLAAFLDGIRRVLSEAREYDRETILLAVRAAEAKIYTVGTGVIEGTIVSVAEALKNALEEYCDDDSGMSIANFVKMRCNKAVSLTPQQNPKLKGREDSGAKGLAELIVAVVDAICAIRGRVDVEPKNWADIVKDSAKDVTLKARKTLEREVWQEGRPEFCLTIKTSQPIDCRALEWRLEELGESVRVSTIDNSTVAHAHVHDVNKVLEIMTAEFADDFAENVEVSNMRMQFNEATRASSPKK